MKDDLPYFSHDNDSRNHPKMKALRARYGWTGYGQFWALNEMIAGSSGARLDLGIRVRIGEMKRDFTVLLAAIDFRPSVSLLVRQGGGCRRFPFGK